MVNECMLKGSQEPAVTQAKALVCGGRRTSFSSTTSESMAPLRAAFSAGTSASAGLDLPLGLPFPLPFEAPLPLL